MEEQLTVNQLVRGSSPLRGALYRTVQGGAPFALRSFALYLQIETHMKCVFILVNFVIMVL